MYGLKVIICIVCIVTTTLNLSGRTNADGAISYLEKFQSWIQKWHNSIGPKETTSSMEFIKQVKQQFLRHNYEAAPFAISWYNDYFQTTNGGKLKTHSLPFPDDALAFSVIKQPKWFTVNHTQCNLTPNRTCEIQQINKILNGLQQGNRAEYLSGSANRTCFLRVQTLYLKQKYVKVDCKENITIPKYLSLQKAGQIAGNSRYYSFDDIKNCNNPKCNVTINSGLSLSPRYGAYFFFGRILIFPDIKISNLLKKQEPLQILKKCTTIADFLCKVNAYYNNGANFKCEDFIEQQVAVGDLTKEFNDLYVNHEANRNYLLKSKSKAVNCKNA